MQKKMKQRRYFDAADVREVFKQYYNGSTMTRIAERLDSSPSTVSRTLRREIYGSVPIDPDHFHHANSRLVGHNGKSAVIPEPSVITSPEPEPTPEVEAPGRSNLTSEVRAGVELLQGAIRRAKAGGVPPNELMEVRIEVMRGVMK